jgi:DNA repair protein RecO (recombination protein O)
MLIKDSGVVLSAARSGETSLSFVFLGRASGKVRVLSKGAMGPRHPTRGAIEPGNEIELLYYQRDGYVTRYLKEASLIGSPGAGRESLPHLAASLAALELLDLVCVPGASLDESIVDTASAFLSSPRSGDPLLMFLAFEIKLLAALGVSPDTMNCVRCGADSEEGTYSPRDGVSFCVEHRAPYPDAVILTREVSTAAACCATESFRDLAGRVVSRVARNELGRLVHWTYTYHVQGYHLPRSLNLI